MAIKKATKKATSTRRAAKKPAAKKYPAKRAAASKAAKRHLASLTAADRESNPYAIHLTFANYQEFARRMTTAAQPGLPKPYYLGNKINIQNFIEYQLIDLGAKVLTNCPANSRDFDAGDKIKVEIDHGGNKQYRISIPAIICEDPNGDVDIEYLKQYVREIRDPNITEEYAAYALLGMYFLSRCR